MRSTSAVPRVVAMALGVWVGLAVVGASRACEVVEFPKDMGVDVGSGFDLGLGLARPSPFLNVARNTNPVGGGQDQSGKVQILETSSQFKEVLNGGSDTSTSFIIFGSSSKKKLMTSKANDLYAINAVAHNTIINRERMISGGLDLTSSAKALLAMEDGLARFHKAYGDRYVHAITTGGEFIGVYTLRAETEEAKKNLTKKAGGHFLMFSSSDKSFAKVVEECSGSRVEDRDCVMIGGRGVPLPTTMEDMVALANGWAGKVDSDATSVPIRMALFDYNAFPEYVAAVGRSQLTWNLSAVMVEMGYEYYDFLVMGNSVGYVLDHPDEFRFKDASHKTATLNTLRAKKREIEGILANMLQKRSQMVAGTLVPEVYADLGLPRAEVFGAALFLPPRYKAGAGALKRTWEFPEEKLPLVMKPFTGPTYRLFDKNASVTPKKGDIDAGRPRKIQVVTSNALEQGGRWISCTLEVMVQQDAPGTPTWRFETLCRFPTPEGLRVKTWSPGMDEVQVVEPAGGRGPRDYAGTGGAFVLKGLETVPGGLGHVPGLSQPKPPKFGGHRRKPLVVEYTREEDAPGTPYAMEQYFPTPAGSASPKPDGGVAMMAAPSSRKATAAFMRSTSPAALQQRELAVLAKFAPSTAKSMTPSRKAARLKVLQQRQAVWQGTRTGKVMAPKTTVPKAGTSKVITPKTVIPSPR